AHRVLVAHVTHEVEHAVTVRRKFGACSFVLAGVRAPDHHVCTARGETMRHAEADARVPPGDEAHAAGEIEERGGHVTDTFTFVVTMYTLTVFDVLFGVTLTVMEQVPFFRPLMVFLFRTAQIFLDAAV
ncbi:MAG: hypothetical protein RL219_1184, partial [Actinomycetota bacterium]